MDGFLGTIWWCCLTPFLISLNPSKDKKERIFTMNQPPELKQQDFTNLICVCMGEAGKEIKNEIPTDLYTKIPMKSITVDEEVMQPDGTIVVTTTSRKY